MQVKSWSKLPVEFQQAEIKPYYLRLRKKMITLFIKRLFDFCLSFLLILVTSPLLLLLTVAIAIDSPGNPFFLQTRISQYKKPFKIIKFRTMVKNADRLGSEVTVHRDPRITRLGKYLRKYRLDELPQLFNILLGQMTFVGTRPEVPHYVDHYSTKMLATLLLPAGVTSLTSVKYRNEQELLKGADNPDQVYIEQILPAKMEYNLEYLNKISLIYDAKIVGETLKALFLG